MRGGCLPENTIDSGKNIGFIFQNKALWRKGHPVPLRFMRVADGAAFGDKLNRSQMKLGAGAELIIFIGGLIHLSERCAGMAEDHCHDGEPAGRKPDPPGRRITLVFGVEEMPDKRTNHQHQRQNHPRIISRKNRRIMAANHHENHRQGEVIIVQRALLATHAITRVRRSASPQGGNDLFLPGDDHHQHIGNHDRADGHTHLDKGTARRENLCIAPGKRHQKDKTGGSKRGVTAAKGAAAHAIIEPPANGNADKADGDRLPRLYIENLKINHIEAGRGEINHRQQSEAGNPRGISLPFEPCQLFRHFGGSNQIFDQIVKAPAMHLPGLTMCLIGKFTPRFQAEIQRDEVKG